MKLRGSWGMSGNSPSKNYTYFGQFSSNGSFMDMDAIKPSSVQLNNLKWETTTQYNAGLDMTFFNDKVSVVLEYYKKVTDDLLQTDVPEIVDYGTDYARVCLCCSIGLFCQFTFERLLDDPDNIEANFRDYLNGFSENVQDILEKFKFDGQLTCYPTGGGVNEVVDLNISIAPSTPIKLDET